MINTYDFQVEHLKMFLQLAVKNLLFLYDGYPQEGKMAKVQPISAGFLKKNQGHPFGIVSNIIHWLYYLCITGIFNLSRTLKTTLGKEKSLALNFTARHFLLLELTR